MSHPHVSLALAGRPSLRGFAFTTEDGTQVTVDHDPTGADGQAGAIDV